MPRPRTRIRLLALAIDLLGAALLGLLLASSVGEWSARRTVSLLQIGQPDSPWRGPLPLVLGVLGAFVYALPLYFVLISLPEALGHRSLGKLLTGLHLAARDAASGAADETAGPPPAPPRGSAARRFAFKLLPCFVWGLALASAWPPLTILFLVSAGMVLLGALPLFAGGRALHDRIAGTQVVDAGRRPV